MSVSRLGALTLGQICVGRARRCACRAKKKCRQATTARPFRREIRGVREEVRRNIKVGGVRSRWGRSVTPSFASGKRKCCLRDSGFGALDAAGQVHPWRGQVHQCGGQVHERVGQGQDRAGQVPPVKRLLARAARRPSGARGQAGGRAAACGQAAGRAADQMPLSSWSSTGSPSCSCAWAFALSAVLFARSSPCSRGRSATPTPPR